MTEMTIASTKKIYKKGSYINDDILLFDDVSDVPFPSDPRRVQCLLLAVCLKGKAQYTVDTEPHVVKANDIIIISEGQVTTDFLLSKDCDGIAVMISKEFFNEIIAGVHEISSLFLFSKNHPVYNLKTEEIETLLTYFNLIKSKADDEDHHFRRDTVRMLMTTMVFDLSNIIYHEIHTGDKKRMRAESIFTKFIELVENNFRHERRVIWYAQQLCISSKYLSESVKQISHRTPNEWIDNYVIQEIRVQLKNTTKSIKEIATEMNFATQSFLGKYFKDHVGTSPSNYRKS